MLAEDIPPAVGGWKDTQVAESLCSPRCSPGKAMIPGPPHPGRHRHIDIILSVSVT